MNYKMTVIIRDPETEQGMSSDMVMNLTASFDYDPNNYGNGHYVGIKGGQGFYNLYDLRYDKDFHRDAKIQWLVDWACRYWNGKNGAYEVKSITVEKV